MEITIMPKIKFPINPTMKSIFEKGLDVVEVQGFIASHKNSQILIFPSKTETIGYLIQEDDVVEVIAPEREEEVCILVIHSNASVDIKQMRKLELKASELPIHSTCHCESTEEIQKAGIVPVSPQQADCRGRCFSKFLSCSLGSGRCNARYSGCNAACSLFGASANSGYDIFK